MRITRDIVRAMNEKMVTAWVARASARVPLELEGQPADPDDGRSHAARKSAREICRSRFFQKPYTPVEIMKTVRELTAA